MTEEEFTELSTQWVQAAEKNTGLARAIYAP